MYGQEMKFEDMVLDVAATTLEQNGVTVQLFRSESGYVLRDVEAGGDLFLSNVTQSAHQAGPRWREVVTEWVGQYLTARAVRLRSPTADELRTSIRTRLTTAREDLTYARPFTPGLCIALAIDTATSVQTHTDASIANTPVDLDELYRLGQINTDAEPIEQVLQIEEDVWGITGDSFFIASKVANFHALLPAIGPAARGVAFAPVNRSLVLYSIIKDSDPLASVMALSSQVAALAQDPSFDHPGGVLSDTTFYWAPDGRVEYLARQSMLVDGVPTIGVHPGPAFSDYAKL